MARLKSFAFYLVLLGFTVFSVFPFVYSILTSV